MANVIANSPFGHTLALKPHRYTLSNHPSLLLSSFQALLLPTNCRMRPRLFTLWRKARLARA